MVRCRLADSISRVELALVQSTYRAGVCRKWRIAREGADKPTLPCIERGMDGVDDDDDDAVEQDAHSMWRCFWAFAP